MYDRTSSADMFLLCFCCNLLSPGMSKLQEQEAQWVVFDISPLRVPTSDMYTFCLWRYTSTQTVESNREENERRLPGDEWSLTGDLKTWECSQMEGMGIILSPENRIEWSWKQEINECNYTKGDKGWKDGSVLRDEVADAGTTKLEVMGNIWIF